MLKWIRGSTSFPGEGDTSHFLALTSSPQLSYMRVSTLCNWIWAFTCSAARALNQEPSVPGENPFAISQVLILSNHWGCGQPWLVLEPWELHSFIPLIPGPHYPPRQVCNEGAVAPLTKSLNNFFIFFWHICCKAQLKPDHYNISGFKIIATKHRHYVVKN